jgi:O-antigen/teichoic acid export membrane protein
VVGGYGRLRCPGADGAAYGADVDGELAPGQPAAPGAGDDGLRRVAGGAAISLVGGGVSLLLSTGYQIVVARNLGATVYGLLVLGLAVSTFLAEACDLGLDYGVLRLGGIARGAGDTDRLRAVVGCGLLGSFAAGTAAAGLLAVSAAAVARTFDKPELASVLIPLALAIPFTAASEVARAALRAAGRALPAVASASLITPGVLLAAGLVAISMGRGAEPIAVAYAVTEAVVAAATLVMVWRVLPAGVGRGRATGLFRYSLPMSFNRLILYSNNQTEVLILGRLAPTGVLGVFGVARRLSLVVGAQLSAIQVLFNPIAADLHHRERSAELDELFKTSTRWLFILGLPTCLAEVLFARELVGLFGPSFLSGAAAVAVLAVGQLVNVGTGTVAQLLAMAGRARLSIIDSVVFLATSVGLDLLLIPRWGMIGAATANAAAVVLVNLLRLWQVHHYLGLAPYDRRFLRPVLAGLAGAVVARLLPLPALGNLEELAARILLLALVYASVLIALGIEPAERVLAAAAIARLRPRKPVRSGQTASPKS